MFCPGAILASVVDLLTERCARSTVILRGQLALFPAPSVAVQVTVVVPRGNSEPDGGRHDTIGVPQLSDAVWEEKLTAAPAAEVPGTVMLGGQAGITGGVLSTTVTFA